MTNNTTQIQNRIRSVLNKMTPREQKILDMRFGLTDNVPHTLAEVAQVFAVTPGRIRQIEARAMARCIQMATKTSR